MATVKIQLTLFSAFYSPLDLGHVGRLPCGRGTGTGMAGLPPGKSAIDSLLDGSAHVVQSALSQRFKTGQGADAQLAHFAQINEMDVLPDRARSGPDFAWDTLEDAYLYRTPATD